MAVTALGVGAPAARADSATLAGAPAVTPGMQTFGNSTGDPDVDDWAISYWSLPTIADDHVTVEFAGNETEYGSFGLDAEPAGTADPQTNVSLADSAIASRLLGSSLQSTLRFVVPKTGTTPLAFTMGYADEGPYDFTAYVLHRAVTQLALLHHLRRAGRVRVQVHDPDGVRLTDPSLHVSLQYELSRGHWHSVGRGSARDGTAVVHYRFPARLDGRRVTVRAEASGSGYYPYGSAVRRVRVG